MFADNFFFCTIDVYNLLSCTVPTIVVQLTSVRWVFEFQLNFIISITILTRGIKIACQKLLKIQFRILSDILGRSTMN